MQEYLKETIETYNTYATLFDTTRSGYTLFERMDDFCSLLKGAHILDVGCASGRDSAIFVEKGYTVTGIDLSAQLIALAKGHVPQATFLEMNATELVFADDTFNGVWANAVFLHLRMPDVKRALKGVYRVLQPDGVFFFSLKQGIDEVVKEEQDLGGARRRTILYDPDTIRTLVKQIGFRVHTFLDTVPDNMPRDTKWIQCILIK